MLMYCYNQNDIYILPDDFDVNNITEDYIMALEEQKPDALDIELFVGTDVMAYDEAQPLLASLINHVNANDSGKVAQLIEEKQDVFANILGLLTYTHAVTEKVNMGAFKAKLSKLKSDLAKANSDNKQLLDKVKQGEEEAKGLQGMKDTNLKDLKNAQARITELEKMLNQGSVIRTYESTNTKLITCKVKIILYFKEITRINYINSFISQFYSYISKILKLKTKLIIYDNPHDYLEIYKPLQCITSGDYVTSRKEITEKMDKLVVIEPNPSILTDVLLSSVYDVVIVYDRLKQGKDIVTGNNVYKYYVVNSMKDIMEIKKKSDIDMTRVITNVGVNPSALTVSYMPDYKAKTVSPRLSAYINMLNRGTDERSVFDIITQATNLDKIS